MPCGFNVFLFDVSVVVTRRSDVEGKCCLLPIKMKLNNEIVKTVHEKKTGNNLTTHVTHLCANFNAFFRKSSFQTYLASSDVFFLYFFIKNVMLYFAFVKSETSPNPPPLGQEKMGSL